MAIVAVIEAGLIDYVEQPRLWTKTASGLEWIGDPEIERRLALAEREQKAIEEPYTVVYSWADPEDRAEVQRLLGATEGPAISDVVTMEERAGVDTLLNAAALTYVAAAVSTLLTRLDRRIRRMSAAVGHDAAHEGTR